MIKNLDLAPQGVPPQFKSTWDDDQPFRVWAHNPSYDEDPFPWKCIAAFRYLLECLDFISYCHSREKDVVFQSPALVEDRKAPPRVEAASSQT